MNLKLLCANWQNLIQDLKPNLAIGNAFFYYLIESHQVSQRHYHNLNHLQSLLEILVEVEKYISNHTAIYVTVWFHDCIYNPDSQTNELESAQLALNFLGQMNADADLMELVEKTILSTRSHKPLINNLDCQLFLDADLSILGASASQYQQYADNIRREYGHLTNRSYVLGRIRVLEDFLSRGKNYYTNYFFDKLEEQAQINIKEELNELKTY